MLLAGAFFMLLFAGFWVFQGAGELFRAIGLTLGLG
jgi:hypothetical protein